MTPSQMECDKSDDECVICRCNDASRKCCVVCKQKICIDCIAKLTESGEPCPFCRQNKGYIEVKVLGGVANKNVDKKALQSSTTTSSIQNEEARTYCSSDQYDCVIDPLIKEKFHLCRRILLDFIFIFGIGIITRLVFGIITPLFAHPKMFVCAY